MRRFHYPFRRLEPPDLYGFALTACRADSGDDEMPLWRRALPLLTVAAAYAALAVVFTWPLAANFTDPRARRRQRRPRPGLEPVVGGPRPAGPARQPPRHRLYVLPHRHQPGLLHHHPAQRAGRHSAGGALRAHRRQQPDRAGILRAVGRGRVRAGGRGAGRPGGVVADHPARGGVPGGDGVRLRSGQVPVCRLRPVQRAQHGLAARSTPGRCCAWCASPA